MHASSRKCGSWDRSERELVPELVCSANMKNFRFQSGRTWAITPKRKWPGRPYPVTIHAAWQGWLLNVPWTLEYTGTFRLPATTGRALLQIATTANVLAQALFGRHYWRRGLSGVGWFAVVERHRSGAPHVHALIVGIPEGKHKFAREVLCNYWEGKVGKCMCSEIRSVDAICRYCSKDLPRGADWAFSRNILEWMPQGA
jgi:hypothetical protein